MKRILLQNDEALLYPKAHLLVAKNSQRVVQFLKSQSFDLVIVEDLDMLAYLRDTFPSVPVAVASPIGSVDQAVKAIQLGALDYIVKPLSFNHLEDLLEKLGSIQRKKIEKPLAEQHKQDLILAESLPMQKLLMDIPKIAQSNASVFISGESGTGKEVIAHLIHYESLRASHPFIKVNCAAIPETLIESEFFGHEKGAFTGALERRIGRFELAHKGTLLLDEVSETPLSLQAKLLRVVQEQEFERVGGSNPLKVDVRIISTSNRNMKERIDQSLFREDLYFRLNVIPIHLPPLRERKEDILALAGYFLERFCEENQKKKKTFSTGAQSCLLNYPWPGNIRELANTIERAVVMSSSDIIEAAQLYLDPKAPDLISIPIVPHLTLAELERQHILETLARLNHNRTKTAQALGISVRTLRHKLNQYRKTVSSVK